MRKMGSIGRPAINVEVRVVDPDGNDVARGEVGEIVYRGPTVMRGYLDEPAATAEAFAGGWFHSGDLVCEDDEGFLYVVDRLKDMIISGGENVYPAEVERVLAGSPGGGGGGGGGRRPSALGRDPAGGRGAGTRGGGGRGRADRALPHAPGRLQEAVRGDLPRLAAAQRGAARCSSATCASATATTSRPDDGPYLRCSASSGLGLPLASLRPCVLDQLDLSRPDHTGPWNQPPRPRASRRGRDRRAWPRRAPRRRCR